MSATIDVAWSVTIDDYPTALGWAPGAALLAIARDSGEIAIVDGTSGAPLGTVACHRQPVTSLAWHPSELVLASAGQDGAVQLTDPSLGTRAVVEPGPIWTDHVSWHPRGKRLAVARGKQVLLIDPASPAAPVVLGPVESTVAGLAWSADGRRLAVACYGGVRLFDIVTGSVAQRLEWRGAMLGVAWSPDGKVIAGGCQDQSVHFWRVASGKDSAMSGFPAKPKDVAWSPDGRWLASSGAPTICLWPFDRRGPEGRAPLELEGHDELVTGLAYAPTVGILLSGDRTGRVCMWAPPEAKQPVGAWTLPGKVSALAWGAAPRAGTVRWAAAAASGHVVGGSL